MDMSGGAAVLEALAAIAELGLPIRIVACVPATENMPSGSATKPGDIITQLNGKTVEVNNTDAEGRLILADALTYCVRDLGADRVVDIATLTGGVVVALGSTYAGLISNDDDWAERVRRGRRAHRRARLAPPAPPRVQGADPRQGRRPHERLGASARPRPSTRRRSSRSSSTASPGRTSTSPEPPGTSAAPTSGTGPPGSASGCSSSWPTRLVAPTSIPAWTSSLTDEQRLLRDTVREFARAEVAPVAEELDRDQGSSPTRSSRRWGSLG